MKKVILLGIMCLMALAMQAQRYAILEFDAAKGISVTQVDGISEMFATCFNPRGYTEVDRSYINRILLEQNLQHSAKTEALAVRVGKIMNVSKVVVGKVSMLGGQYQVDVKVIDVETEVSVAKAGTTVTGAYRDKICGLAKSLAGQIAIKPGTDIQPSKPVNQEYVDLGLPSGTKWKSSNEKGGFITYDEAIKKYGGKLPTSEQWEELKGMCTWTWSSKGYKVTGPNGKFITLPAAGARFYKTGNVEGVGTNGGYWSSTSSNNEEYAWALGFSQEYVRVMDGNRRCNGYSVRLVQN